MKNNIALILLAAALAVGGAAIAINAGSSDDTSTTQDSQKANSEMVDSNDQKEVSDSVVMDDSPASESTESSTTEDNAAVEPVDQPVVTASVPGEYVDYYDGAIESTTGTKILFFHADWCSQCLRLEQDILAQGVPDDTTIFNVNFDDRTDLRQKYGVTLQTHTVLVDDQGNKLNDYSGFSSPTLQSVLDNLL